MLENTAIELSGNPVVAVPLLYVAGVLTSLTPCVYPMIPITAAIVGNGSFAATDTVHNNTSGRSFGRVAALTITYVAGLAIVYASLGVFAGLSGTMFGTISANPWAFFIMANLLLIAALAMLDAIPVRLPSALLQKAASVGNSRGLSGVFVMGAASGLVAAPCSAPVMAAVLTWVSTTRSAVLGFTYLFAFSLGMCSLLILVGLSSGVIGKLPRAGAWMLTVKKLFAVVMLGMAEYYLVKMGQVFF